MNPLNEESNSQYPSQASNELPTPNASVTPAFDVSDALPVKVAKPKSTRKRTADAPLKESSKSEKSRRAGQRKVGAEQPTVAEGSTTPMEKPPRAKRTQKQSVAEMASQPEPVDRPNSASNSKATQESEARSQASSGASEIPAVTPSAIQYLGKKNATLADYIKLDPDSLAFVRFHLKRMHQLEADSMPASAYAGRRALPVSPALQRFADARAHGAGRNRGSVDIQTGANPIEVVDQAQMGTANLSFGQNAAGYQSYGPVVVQLRKFDMETSTPDLHVRAGVAASDDSERLRRVRGTAQILMAEPNLEPSPRDAADLAASDIKEVRAIEDAVARRLALSAVMESGYAQPRYHSEFARQAPDLVESATQAHRAVKADWGLAYEANNALSDFVDSPMPSAKGQTTALARRTIAAIRAIEISQYRDEVLILSHQAGLLHSQYRTEFAHYAPDLVAAAEVAYIAQGSHINAVWKAHQTDENSIEQSPVLLVGKTQPINLRGQATREVPSAPENVGKQQADLAAFDKPTAPETAGQLNLGRRLFQAFAGARGQMITWLATQRAKAVDAVDMALPSSDKPNTALPQNDDKSSRVPESVVRQFLKVESEYYFRNRTPAFSDRGSKLATRGTNLEVIHALVEIAKARGWDTVIVKGSDEFRRSAWMEATVSGLTVAGYKPTALDLADLANRPANNAVENGAIGSKEGKPLERTARQPFAPSDTVRPANVQTTQPEQKEQTEQTSESLRFNSKLVEKGRAFAEGKPEIVVTKYPDLAGAYGIVAAARAFATEKLPEASRNEFTEMVRRHVFEKITAGQQIQGPKIYSEPTKTIDVGDRLKSPLEPVDRGKWAQVKSMGREQ